MLRLFGGAMVVSSLDTISLDVWASERGIPPFRYALASSLFGKASLEEILSVTKSTGAEFIDLWPLPHGSQRNQVEEMGRDCFAELLNKYELKLGLTTRFDLGPFRLKEEIDFVADFKGKMIVTGPGGTKGLKGDELKREIVRFYENLKPHLESFEKRGLVLAVENHSNMLLDSPDAVRYFADCIDTDSVGLAFAPYHLPQDETLLSDLIRHCGRKIALFYAWQHGKGSSKLPKEDELLQLPGRGPLDFRPLLKSLREIRFDGFTEIFMHPFPRGIGILDTVEQSAAEIFRAKKHLDSMSG